MNVSFFCFFNIHSVNDEATLPNDQASIRFMMNDLKICLLTWTPTILEYEHCKLNYVGQTLRWNNKDNPAGII